MAFVCSELFHRMRHVQFSIVSFELSPLLCAMQKGKSARRTKKLCASCILEEKETRWAQQKLAVKDLNDSKKILAAWHGRAKELALCPNANHCIKTALRCSPKEYVQFIIDELQACPDTLLSLIKHVYGCRAFVAMVERFGGETSTCSRAFQCMENNFEEIAMSDYGCYVVAALFDHHGSSATATACRSQLHHLVQTHGDHYVKKQKNGPLITLCFAATQSGELLERKGILDFMRATNETTSRRRYPFAPTRLRSLTKKYEEDVAERQPQYIDSPQNMEIPEEVQAAQDVTMAMMGQQYMTPIFFYQVWIPNWGTQVAAPPYAWLTRDWERTPMPSECDEMDQERLHADAF